MYLESVKIECEALVLFIEKEEQKINKSIVKKQEVLPEVILI